MEAAPQAFKIYGKYDLFLKWLHIFPLPSCLLATEQNNWHNWLLNFTSLIILICVGLVSLCERIYPIKAGRWVPKTKWRIKV